MKLSTSLSSRKVRTAPNKIVKAEIMAKVPGSVVVFNQVPKSYQDHDLYQNLYFNEEEDNDFFEQNPRLGAFEVSYQGKLLFSKLLSGYWPNVGIVSGRAEKIVEAIRRELDFTPYLAKSL